MALQNRVTPLGDVIVHSARGTFMGNRGILHGADQRLGQARWRHPHWVTCVLAYKDWHREVMQPNNYTELFFLDEATALAAGHRPCALCRRRDYDAFQEALSDALHRDDSLGANALDRMLHTARIAEGTRRQKRFEAVLDNVPSGAMIRFPGDPEQAWLVQNDHLLRWQPEGYDAFDKRPMGKLVDVLTPRPSVLALQRGYQPFLHPSAESLLVA
ncbi:MAG: hypothetical protein ACR2QF_17800 [Geminicoccaceae bacterium]